MTDTIQENQYTKEDFEQLKNACSKDFKSILEANDCDPKKIKNILKSLPTIYKIVYQVPLEDLILSEYLNRNSIQGFLRWRFSIGK